MPVPTGVWGIDIGQCALKAIRLEMIEGSLTATAFDYVEHPKILSQPDADPDSLTQEALETFLSRNQLGNDLVAISVPGQSGLARFVKLPPVEERKIADIVRFEAKQQIPFPLEEVVWDFQKIGAGVVADGFAMETEIGLFAMKRDMISRFLSHFQTVNVEVHYVQMAPLALLNYSVHDLLKRDAEGAVDGEQEEDDDDDSRGKKRCVVSLDIGTDASNLVITDGGKIVWQRPIPIGGNHFTKALSKDLKLTFAKAEHVKRNAAKSPDLAKILKALKPVLSDFVSEVQRSLGYFTNTHRDAYVSYMVGLGSAFRLPGLQRFLAEKLSLDVRKPVKFERLGGDASVTGSEVFKENMLSFPVAYGLALQGLGLSRLRTNLLPPEITVDRKIRAKKPYAVAAAAMLMLGTAAMTFGYSVQYSAVADTRIQKAIKDTTGILGRVENLNKEITAKQEDVATTQSDVKTIIAGQEERLNWIRLNEFINRNLPLPGSRDEGGTLWERGQESYWSTKEGRDAFDDFKRRLVGGVAIDAPINTKLRTHLAMVDVDAIYCRYTDNLATFFENAKKTTKAESGIELDGMLKEDMEKAPEGEGWVVELRGTTYHQKGREFIKAGLVRNLATRERYFGPPPENDPTFAKRMTDPIYGKVTHVFIFDVHEDKVPQGNNLVRFGAPLIDSLMAAQQVAGGAGTIGMPMGGSMPMGGGFGDGAAAEADPVAAAATAIASWQPITAGGSNATGVGGMGMSPRGEGSRGIGPMAGGLNPRGVGGVGAFGGPMGSPMGGVRPFVPSVGVGPMGQGGNTPVDPDVASRFEFLVIFIWKEPTPSERPTATDGSTPAVTTNLSPK